MILPTDKKPKILLLSDDLRMHSGIATMSREIVMGTVRNYDWVQIAGAINHPDKGKVVSISDAVRKETGVSDANVILYPNDGYGNEDILYAIIDREKPQVIMHFTDPRFWGWLYAIEKQLRKKYPLTYLNIWDDIPFPMYNKPYYESCDLLMSISKQTYNINKHVCGPKNCLTVNDTYVPNKQIIHYVPHGINEKMFKPIADDDSMLKKRRLELFRGKDYEYVIFYNSRNVQRKRTSNIVLAYRTFCDNLTKEQASKCILVLHTEVKCDAGTDLIAVKESLCPDYDIAFSPSKIPPADMTIIYNIADVTINLSSNEGFGLSTAESLMSGTPIIATVTGGLQDQIGQVKDDGSPIEFTSDFGSNNVGKYKKHGTWVYPIWPATSYIQGSIPTPYIFDDIAKWEDAADGMMYWYLMGKEKRDACGLKGREWAMSDGGINATNMCKQFVNAIDYTLKNWQPVKQFGLFSEKDYVGNQMINGLGFRIPTIDKDKILRKIESINI
jgi:glycosyltransferase involved in cell wall biosynthesis